MNKFFLIILILICSSAQSLAYDPIYLQNITENSGDIPVVHDGNGIPSTMTRWKSSRIRATGSGVATHFIIRVGKDDVGSVPVGFAVYSGSSGERDPIGPLLIRGYYESYNFTSAGYYALPFTSGESIEIVSGNYYHLTYLLTPGNEQAESGWRVGEESPPPKWFSNCKGDDCSANEPPGVGEEYWNDQYWPSSAGWAMGLLDSSSGINGDDTPDYLDQDDDGLLDEDEINIYGTDPLNTDTDGDGLSDLDEVTEGSDPLLSDAGSDDNTGDNIVNEGDENGGGSGCFIGNLILRNVSDTNVNNFPVIDCDVPEI